MKKIFEVEKRKISPTFFGLNAVYTLIVVVAALVIVLDIYTKHLAEMRFVQEGNSTQVFSWFNFTLVYNYGAAFGMFRALPEVIRKIFLLSLTPIVLFVLWRAYVAKFRSKERVGPVAIGLIVGGASGNFFDRLSDGRVTDFIDWFYRTNSTCLPQFFRNAQTCHWPVFNLADCAITLAMILLVVHSFRGREHNKSLRLKGK